MFKKLLDELLEAKTEKEITHILYRLKSDTEDWGLTSLSSMRRSTGRITKGFSSWQSGYTRHSDFGRRSPELPESGAGTRYRRKKG
jgi:hypothetical protein